MITELLGHANVCVGIAMRGFGMKKDLHRRPVLPGLCIVDAVEVVKCGCFFPGNTHRIFKNFIRITIS